MDKLADELLKEILSPPLRVNDDMFADTNIVSPFSKATSSASDVLLVCKRFMRVGTPALYETVVIRSTAQAQALRMALTRNPEFGRFVRKLRLEGVYDQYFNPAVIDVLTRVTDFCFTLSVYSSDKLAGLYRALTGFDPVRVILTLHDDSRTRNAQHRNLVDNLCSAVAKWTKLERFCFSNYNYQMYNLFTSHEKIASALGKSKSLQRVDVFLHWHGYAGMNSSIEALLTPNNKCKLVIQRPSSPVVGIKLPVPIPLRNRVFFASSSARLLTFDEAEDPESVPTAIVSLNPFYTPMHKSSREVRLRIWGRIFFFAVGTVHEDTQYTSIWPALHSKWMDRRTAKALILVSRDFRDAALPAVVEHMRIRNHRSYKISLSWLNSGRPPNLGGCVKKLLFAMHGCCTNDPEFSPKWLFETLSDLKTAHLLGYVPPLIDGLPALGSSTGNTLHQLQLELEEPFSSQALSRLFSLSVFANFIALTELTIDGDVGRFTAAEDSSVFPNLRVLNVHKIHASFYSSLCQADLPSLRICRIHQGVKKADKFLKEHGQKLEAICVTNGVEQTHLDAMTSLQTLELFDDAQATLLTKLKNDSLEELRLNWAPRGTGLSRFRDMAHTLSASQFPALKKVVAVHKPGIWPTSERDIKKSPWPDISATLAERGVTLVDSTGRAWRPRLQVR